MEQTRITITEYCSYHDRVEPQFISALLENGLIDPAGENESGPLIPFGQLHDLERYIRLHYDLDINIEGLEAIRHLLNRVDSLQQELLRLQTRLAFYEGSSEQWERSDIPPSRAGEQ